MPTISLLLPSRGRREILVRMLKSAAATAAEPADIECVLYLDDDDMDSHDVEVAELKLVKLIGPRLSMGEYSTACMRAASGDIFFFVNDDIIVRTEGWDRIVRRLSDRFSDGIYLAYPNDLFKGRSRSTFPILSRRCCALMGRAFPEEYTGSLLDPHLFDLFKRLEHLGHPRRIVYLEDVVFEHMHVFAGKAVLDATYRARNRFGDDQVFCALGSERQRAAERLAAAIADRPLPPLAEVPAVPPAARWVGTTIFRYFRAFLFDRGLAWRRRLHLFVWFGARCLYARLVSLRPR